MERNNVEKVSEFVPGSDNFNTSPIEPAFVGICHPDMARDLKELTNFIHLREYGTRKMMDGEIGSTDEIRWVSETSCRIQADSGGSVGTTGLKSTTGSNVDVYSAYILGKDAYARIKFNKKSIETIVKPLGSGGTSDPLNQIMTAGWKCRYNSVILYTEKVLVFKTGVSA